MPSWGLSVLLPQAIGVRRAREMSFTGNFLDAAEALAVGLVNHVVAHDELIPFTRRIAADIVGNDQAGGAPAARAPTPRSPTTTTRGRPRPATRGRGSATMFERRPRRRPPRRESIDRGRSQ